MQVASRRSSAKSLCAKAACVLIFLSPAPAFAQPRQPAPITYAGQGSAGTTTIASLEPSLAGGDERSYGYGASQTSTNAAPLDLRRAPSAAPQSAASASGQGTPSWLEHERVGAPYQVSGRWYVPAAEPGYDQTGTASWYGPTFHGGQTASGETYDQEAMTAAHPTLPIPSLVQVTNLDNGREVILRVNDRGPFVGDRVIDVSHRAAEVLGFDRSGTAHVNVRYLGPAPRHVMATGAPSPAPAPQMAQASYQPESAPLDGPRSLLPPETQTAPTREDTVAPVEFAMPAAQPVSTPASYTPPAASGGYYVQVGAFADEANAHRVEAAVRSAGPVAVDTRQTVNGTLFRVRIGPIDSRDQAEAARRNLANLGYGESILAQR